MHIPTYHLALQVHGPRFTTTVILNQEFNQIQPSNVMRNSFLIAAKLRSIRGFHENDKMSKLF